MSRLIKEPPVIEKAKGRSSSWKGWFSNSPGFLISFAFHLLLLFVLLHIYLPGPLRSFGELVFQPGVSEGEDFSFLNSDSLLAESNLDAHLEATYSEPLTPQIDVEQVVQGMSPDHFFPQTQSDFDTERFPSTTSMSSLLQNDFAGRGEMKNTLVAIHGGSEGSERAVQRGLNWLLQHQHLDGGWSYDFQKSPKCRAKCGNPGKSTSRNSATALALLPFLGSGITHKEGKKEHREAVEKGLKFLMNHSRLTSEGLSFIDVKDADMYHQGLAAIAICEAAAMSQDPHLKEAAQRTADFIGFAQIPKDGGWRYKPRDSSGGDTSVVGWQVMALQSARIGGAKVPGDVFLKARRFLDTVVGAKGGSIYGYQSNRDVPDGIRRDVRATTSIGLLSQMYMGWKVDNPALIRGVNYLSDKGPDSRNLYYNYYATQVMHHYGGDAWYSWNLKLRDHLIDTQCTEGHELGSWFYPGQWNDTGGRLYCTSLALLILEVYYRHLPLYQQQSVETDFPLD